ncbi:hypothetical protein GCM10009530_31930 [Microbispora corallina]|uniref:Uncharacterized protein n=1 Tax=Microbispora corallina TaxID=83302 RepID=A0ABQ4G0A9_9ACTN|nr:hypothetical protein [Microbispora corallina]GIH40477.1 hypothetical protein Mco01_34770 [Microbispora corallina]
MDYTSYGPGVIAFAIVAAIGLALFFLLKSMNRQFAKIQTPDDRRDDRPSENGSDT